MKYELLRERLRQTVRDLPDAANVSLAVRDVRACLEVLADVKDEPAAQCLFTEVDHNGL